MIEAKIKNLKRLQKDVTSIRHQETAALNTAVKVEAFGLSRQLKQEIRSGSPGGRRFKTLTVMARRRGKGFKANRPLQRLALPIRYHVQSKNPFKVAVGWTGPRVSESWKKIAERQQEGFTEPVSTRRRRFFMHRGAELSTRSRNRKYLFLRDETTTMHTPERPILDPFWRAHQSDAWRNIRFNFRRKLRGERI